MNQIPHRFAALVLTLALALSLIAPGFASQESSELPANPAAQAEVSLPAEPEPSTETVPDASAEPEPSTETVPDTSAEAEPSTETVPDASAEAEPSTETVPDASTETEPSTETVPDASAEAEPSTETVPDTSAEADVSPDGALTIQEEETPADIWWQTDEETFAEKVDYEYNGSQRKPAYRIMRGGVQTEASSAWTEAWYEDEACTVPVKDFVEVGTRYLRLMDGDTVKAQGSYRIVQAEQRITAASGVVARLFKRNASFQLSVKSSGGGALRYVSSDPSVVTVDRSGKCTMLRLGTADITVTTEETEHYRQATGTISVSLYKKARKLSYSKSYRNSKYYRALAKLQLTGSTGENAADIALSQLGYREGRKSGQFSGNGRGWNMSNWTEYGRYYGLNHQPWCAIFVNWCAREAGASYSAVPKYCAVRYYHSYFRRKGRFHSWSKVRSGSYKPKKGDIILYAYSKGGVAHHIGFVLDVTYEDGRVKLTTVEGNTNDRVRTVSMNFSRRSVGRHGSHYILGVANPKW